MNQNDPINFISSLEVQAPKKKFEFSLTRSGDAVKIVDEAKEQSFLSDKSVVSFVSQVNEQNRKDVLNSTLLAQMAANKKFPSQENITEWYNSFIDTLSKIGWNIQSADMSIFEDSKSVFEIEDAIIDILASAFGGGFVAVVGKTLESLKKMSKDDHKIIAFEKNTHTLSKGCFQLALATEENGMVSLQLGTFLLTSSKKIKQILFFTSKKDKTRLEYSSRTGTLNSEIYSNVRNAVVAKLGENINAYIAEIEI